MRIAWPFVAGALVAALAAPLAAQDAKKLSDPTVPTATTVGTGDLFYILQSGTGKKISGTNLGSALSDLLTLDGATCPATQYVTAISATGAGTCSVLADDSIAHPNQIEASNSPSDQWVLAWDTDAEIFVWQNTAATVPDGSYGALTVTGGVWLLSGGAVADAGIIETFGDTPATGDCLSWGGFGNMLWEPRTKDNVYTLTVEAASALSMTDAQTIYFGGRFAESPNTTGGEQRVYIPIDGTITGAHLYAFASTAGSAEGWTLYVRKNNSTDTAIAVTSVSSQHRTWQTNGLSIAVTAGDYVEIKSVNPTWATNPAAVRFSGSLVVTR